MENEIPPPTTPRTLSEAVRLWILPEIQKRLISGQIMSKEIPFELSQFRFLQWHSEMGAESVVELNDEVQVVVKTALTGARELKVGQEVYLSDIDPGACFIEPPRRDDRPCAYFFACRSFLNWSIFFDSGPNWPQPLEEMPDAKLKFPLGDLVRRRQLIEKLDPTAKFDILTQANWPPSPAYFPKVMIELHQQLAVSSAKLLFSSISNQLDKEYWNDRLRLWKYYDIFKDRCQYVEKSLNYYFLQDWMGSIYILVPHFEGIVGDYLQSCGQKPVSSFKGRLQQLKRIIHSRRVLLYPRHVLEVVIQYLETGTFLTNTRNISDPQIQINRHGILHGEFHDFENQEIALKYLVLLDGLAFVLLHDMMVSRSI
jgi:hypothetical protein